METFEMKNNKKSIVSIIMGSQSDWEFVKPASDILNEFSIKHECKIISAHRTPKRHTDYAKNAKKDGIKIILAAAGGAAHLPGVTAALTTLPVLGIPISSNLLGLDSLLSIVQMPAGVPVATFSIGTSGSKNAALYAIRILDLDDKTISNQLDQYIKKMEKKVPKKPKK